MSPRPAPRSTRRVESSKTELAGPREGGTAATDAVLGSVGLDAIPRVHAQDTADAGSPWAALGQSNTRADTSKETDTRPPLWSFEAPTLRTSRDLRGTQGHAEGAGKRKNQVRAFGPEEHHGRVHPTVLWQLCDPWVPTTHSQASKMAV